MFHFDHHAVQPSPNHLVGRAIGIRAGMLGLGLETPDSPGFQVTSGQEIDALRAGKSMGSYMARQGGLGFVDTLRLQLNKRKPDASLWSSRSPYQVLAWQSV